MSRVVQNTWQSYSENGRIPSVFSAEECARIVETYSEKGWISPEIRDQPDTDTDFRPRWILSSDSSANWIFDRLEKAVGRWNDGGFNFKIDLYESLHLVCRQPGAATGWRSDLGSGMGSRGRLSTVVVLSPANAYAGGGMEFVETEFGAPTFDAGAGDVIVYAAWLPYQFLPVTSGKFWTLSTWWLGARPLR